MRCAHRLLVTGLVAVLAVPAVLAAPSAGASTGPTDSHTQNLGRGDLIVARLDADAGDDEVADALADAGLELVDDTAAAGEFVLTRVVDGSPPGEIVDGDVIVSAEAPEPALQLAVPPNDELYRTQWNLPKIQTVEAWDHSTGEGAVIAVVDGGIAREAPDLATTRFVDGYDFVSNDTDPYSLDDHGTHVAATIAQGTNNLIGAAGIAPDASIMPLRVFSDDSVGFDMWTAAAIRWAVDHGADVINLSLGFAKSTTVMSSAIDYAEANGVILVAAAGNENGLLVWPASHPYVMAVAATDIDDNRAEYSNMGAELTISAPGGDYRYDRNNDGALDAIVAQSVSVRNRVARYCYCQMQGTSMAAPHVSAAVALIVAAGVSDADLIREAIVETARDLGPAGHDTSFGYGLLQTADAIAYAKAATPIPEPGEPVSGTRPETPYDPAGLSYACPVAADHAMFSDVTTTMAHAPAISCLAGQGITHGVGGGRYAPAAVVTRGQMATFLVRLIEAAGTHLNPAAPDAFDDDDGDTHELHINQLAELGVVAGVSPGRYDPSGNVSRAAMASFLVRTYDKVGPRPLRTWRDAFDDDSGNLHERQINKVAAAGIAAGTTPGRYSPTRPVTRAQMATFLARTLDRLTWAAEAN